MKYVPAIFKGDSMNIQAIQDNIEELETADTTVENVKELALLYIVRDNLKKSLELNGNSTISEYNDILPQYRRYIEIKRAYQLGKTSEKEVEKSIKNMCKEVQEFIYTMYKCSDMPQERRQLKSMLEKLTDLLY